MSGNISSALKDWIPFKFFEQDDIEYCQWLYMADEKIKEPFFSDTISKCKNLISNQRRIKSISTLSILPEWAGQNKGIEPTAFIFHISRCGSTLVSQLLGLQSSNIILSEVPFFDDLLRQGFKKNNFSEYLPWLKAAINLYGAKRNESSMQLFIKTDSWHIHFYKELRQLYPETPFILLYRRPDEVLRSQQKNRGMQAVPGLLEPEIFGFAKEEIPNLSLDEYMSRVIETYLKAFIDIIATDNLSLLVNYNEGALNIVKKILAFTKSSVSDEDITAMKERASFHGKYPEQIFSEEKLHDTVPAYLQRSFELYNEIEKISKSF